MKPTTLAEEENAAERERAALNDEAENAAETVGKVDAATENTLEKLREAAREEIAPENAVVDEKIGENFHQVKENAAQDEKNEVNLQRTEEATRQSEISLDAMAETFGDAGKTVFNEMHDESQDKVAMLRRWRLCINPGLTELIMRPQAVTFCYVFHRRALQKTRCALFTRRA